MEVQEEYARLKALLEGTDEKQLALSDGELLEAARMRCELNELNEIVKATGLIKINPSNPLMQKELPVSKIIVKLRANYLNYMAKLSNRLGKSIDEGDDLDDYN